MSLDIDLCFTGLKFSHQEAFVVTWKKKVSDWPNILILSITYTVEPRNNSPAFKGSPSIKVNILRSQMIVFNVISPLFKGYPEIKVKKK